MQTIPCPKTPVRNQSMLNNLKGSQQQGTGTSTTKTSMYLYYNKCRLWQIKSMPDSRYTIQNRPKCKNTSTSEKAQDMCFAMCQKTLRFLCQLLSQAIEEISVILLETFYIWKILLYSHTIGDQRTRPILDMLCLSSQGSEFCHPLKCPDLMPPHFYIWVHQL